MIDLLVLLATSPAFYMAIVAGLLLVSGLAGVVPLWPALIVVLLGVLVTGVVTALRRRDDTDA